MHRLKNTTATKKNTYLFYLFLIFLVLFNSKKRIIIFIVIFDFRSNILLDVYFILFSFYFVVFYKEIY